MLNPFKESTWNLQENHKTAVSYWSIYVVVATTWAHWAYRTYKNTK